MQAGDSYYRLQPSAEHDPSEVQERGKELFCEMGGKSNYALEGVVTSHVRYHRRLPRAGYGDGAWKECSSCDS